MAELLDQVRTRTKLRHESIRTETQCVQWIRRCTQFHGKRPTRDRGAREAGVSASMQNRELSALLFLYRETLQFQLSLDKP